MYQHLFPGTEVAYRQQHVRTGYIEAQRLVTISGIRQILGNTILEVGSRIHGMAQAPCPAAAETRRLVRDIRRAPSTAST